MCHSMQCSTLSPNKVGSLSCIIRRWQFNDSTCTFMHVLNKDIKVAGLLTYLLGHHALALDNDLNADSCPFSSTTMSSQLNREVQAKSPSSDLLASEGRWLTATNVTHGSLLWDSDWQACTRSQMTKRCLQLLHCICLAFLISL